MAKAFAWVMELQKTCRQALKRKRLGKEHGSILFREKNESDAVSVICVTIIGI
jgi:hypothetical protein